MNNEKTMSALDDAALIHKAFVMLPTEVVADVAKKRISPFALTLYAFLLFWQGSKEHLWFNEVSMARESGVSRATIGRALAQLEEAGHILRKRRMNASWLTKCATVIRNGMLYVRRHPVKRMSKNGAGAASTSASQD